MITKRQFLPHEEGMIVRQRGFAGIILNGQWEPLGIAGGAYGTLSTLDALAAIRQSVAQYGEDEAWRGIEVALAARNKQVADMRSTLVEISTDAQRAYGGGDVKTMVELDQWGLPDAQKITAGVTVGFPLRRYGNTLQWTRQWMMSNTVAQLAAEVQAILDADAANMIRAYKVAIFNSVSATFVDKLGVPANVSLAQKPFVNNDGLAIPVGPNGETFATSHNHYLGSATLTAAAVSNLIVTVQEHYNSGTPVLYISQTDEAAFRALSGFVADVDVRVTQPTTATTAGQLDIANLYDRRIGLFGAAEVWIKPWMIANYIFCYVQGAPVPLVMRVPPNELADLQLMYQDDRHPLYAQGYERQFGVSVWNRTNGAVLYFANATYAVPTIT